MFDLDGQVLENPSNPFKGTRSLDTEQGDSLMREPFLPNIVILVETLERQTKRQEKAMSSETAQAPESSILPFVVTSVFERSGCSV